MALKKIEFTDPKSKLNFRLSNEGRLERKKQKKTDLKTLEPTKRMLATKHLRKIIKFSKILLLLS